MASLPSRWLIFLSLVFFLFSSACNDFSARQLSPSPQNGGIPGGGQSLSGLSYTYAQAYYYEGAQIIDNSPSLAVGTAQSFSISPSLPTGLSFDTSSGTISGIPATVQGASNYTVTAYDVSGSTSATISISIDQSPAGVSVVFSQNSPGEVTAGACVSIEMDLLDGNNAPYPAPEPAAMLLEPFGFGSLSSEFIVYSDTQCQNAIGSVDGGYPVVIPAGQSSITVGVRIFNMNDISVSGPYQGNSADLTISIKPSSMASFQASEISVAEGICSPVFLSGVDQYGNPSLVSSSAVQVGIAASSSTASLYSDPSCQHAATQLTIPSGSNSVYAYVLDSAPESFNLNLSATNLVPASIPIYSLDPSIFGSETLIMGPSFVPVGACVPFQLQENGVASVSSPVSITFDNADTLHPGNDAAGNTYSDPSCGTVAANFTIPAGSNFATFYYKATAVGSTWFETTPTAFGLVTVWAY